VRAYRIAAVQSTEQSRLLQSKALPAFELALQSQEQLYAQGKANVLQVWQTLRILNDAQREALSVWVGAITARVELSLFVGEEL
jgi:outer membrane protein TolC